VEELDELEHLPGPLSSIPALAADEEPILPVLITETQASVDELVMAETPSCLEGDVTVSELSETYDDVEVSGTSIAHETPQAFPVVEESQKIAKKSVHVSLTSFPISDTVHSGQVCLLSTNSTPPRSLNLAPSASIFLPTTEPTATDWSPRPLLVSSLVDGFPLHPRFQKRVARRLTLQLENSSINPQSKTLQPLPSHPLLRKTRKRNLVGAQSCERQGPPPLPYASEFVKLIIVFITFILVLYFTFYYA
jgi:hypothetical protein